VIVDLPSTTTVAVSKKLVQLRQDTGAMALSRVLTLVIVVGELDAEAAIDAATDASHQHPCRIIAVVLSNKRGKSRLDGQIRVGGDAGASEVVVLRLFGALTDHGRSVVTPLLLPDSPVVAWWPTEAPSNVSQDPIGAMAQRRITDAAEAKQPKVALRNRAKTYAGGDTDLAWTRITPWRTLVAGAFDTLEARVTGATVVAPDHDPTAALMRGWLAARLHITPKAESTTQYPRMRAVELTCENGDVLRLTREDGTATFSRTGQVDRQLPLARRPLGDELAEELRRLDADQIYAEALGALAGIGGLEERSPNRVHIWKDPAVSERPDAPADPVPDGAGAEPAG